jgi:AbrB family looped-hinge helix DNA binding protein
MEKTFYKSRLRTKGQITVPQEIRSVLGAEEGDDLVFYTDEHGRIVISRAQVIPPDQAWFWNERWQRLEQEAQSDLDSGRVVAYHTVREALSALDELKSDYDADD